MKSSIVVHLLFPLLLSSSVLAQIGIEKKYDPQKTVRKALQRTVQLKYGNSYVINYHIMDSLLAHSPPNRISDPFGTLKGCVLFSSRPSIQSDDSVVTGIFKNGQIIWDDYPGSKAGFGGYLITAKDINNDGRFDILVSELDHERLTAASSVSYLWILSWNGVSGEIINDVDPITHQSTLVSTDGWYKLVDNDQGGPMTIKGEIPFAWQDDFPKLNPKTLPEIIYEWNGSKYLFIHKRK